MTTASLRVAVVRSVVYTRCVGRWSMGRLARTLARRRCGQCERDLGLALWPWSGQWFVTTHGLCDGCFALGEREADARRRPGRPALRRAASQRL